jgi:hypothetical protein
VTRRSIRPDLSNGLKWPLFFIGPFDRAQMFARVSRGRFPWVAIELLLGDEEVWSARIEQRVKIAISYDPTVGSCSKFCTSFRMPFSLGFLWNSNSVTRMSGRPNFSNGLKGP